MLSNNFVKSSDFTTYKYICHVFIDPLLHFEMSKNKVFFENEIKTIFDNI